MRTHLSVLIIPAVTAFLAVVVVLSAAGAGETAPTASVRQAVLDANAPDPRSGQVLPAVSPGEISDAVDARELLSLPMERLLALAGGVAIGTTLVGSLGIGGGQFLGILAGGVIGEYWYQHQLPPLNLFE